jgi:hypothetical protein
MHTPRRIATSPDQQTPAVACGDQRRRAALGLGNSLIQTRAGRVYIAGFLKQLKRCLDKVMYR